MNMQRAFSSYRRLATMAAASALAWSLFAETQAQADIGLYGIHGRWGRGGTFRAWPRTRGNLILGYRQAETEAKLR
jgi:hypothetical protein